MGLLLPSTIAILLITYLTSDRVRSWWHSPVPLLPSFFFARTRLHFMFGWLLIGLLIASLLLWVERPLRYWDLSGFLYLIAGLFTIKEYDWIVATREWMAEQQANGKKTLE
jgi:hypothetical protein